MKYVKSTKEKSGIIHVTHPNGTPRCSRLKDYEEIEGGEFDKSKLCKQCIGNWNNAHSPQYYAELREKIIENLETEWMNPRDLAEELEVSPTAIRWRVNELYRVGKLHRRGGLRDADGSKGYEYSQQAMPKANYEENTNLFESMLNGD